MPKKSLHLTFLAVPLLLLLLGLLSIEVSALIVLCRQSLLDTKVDEARKEKRKKKMNTARRSGFYISRLKIAGCFLIMFAQRKVEKKVDIDTDFIDPLNLLVISRPNTGKNHCEMASPELRYKYNLLISSTDLIDSMINEEFFHTDGEEKTERVRAHSSEAMNFIRNKWGGTVADLWDDAFENSNFAGHHDGLAPRISEVGLITGSVLHILPALEKAVQFTPQSQRSLRVIGVELSDSGQRIVGIKFPVSNEAIVRLMMGMKEVLVARQDSFGSTSFVDEAFSPVDKKAMSWATSKRKTKESFFGSATSKSADSYPNMKSGSRCGNSQQEKRKGSSSCVKPSLQNENVKRQKSISTNKGPANKKSRVPNISSFFGVLGTK